MKEFLMLIRCVMASKWAVDDHVVLEQQPDGNYDVCHPYHMDREALERLRRVLNRLLGRERLLERIAGRMKEDLDCLESAAGGDELIPPGAIRSDNGPEPAA